MAIQLNHTIVPARDARASAIFLSEILGLSEPVRFGPFWTVTLDNGVTLDYQDSDEAMPIEHYAFLVSEAEFDSIFTRIKQRALEYWADPMHSRPFEINRNDGGRGLYWNDPNGHYLEIITRPYGSGA
ncbi:VOC family protein [Steroidobacter sp. S1-65]|uniref:VOC family protein n=1 Tax=Steroidobacter gossypii TaxID=2805490 RepID=A0ABS1X4D0_9GAMM|nr:VOC family protein [Steroidobacter gossypii]MBM0108084.1 VOC family protein [Steroidobacter gossypii]